MPLWMQLDESKVGWPAVQISPGLRRGLGWATQYAAPDFRTRQALGNRRACLTLEDEGTCQRVRRLNDLLCQCIAGARCRYRQEPR
jgi:hypothetical protein